MASPTDQWNSRYNTEIFQYGTAPNDFLAAQTARLANAKSILCLAEGEGRNALHILKNVPGARVVCVDLSAIGLDKAKKLFLKEGIDESRFETVVADLAEYDIGSGKWEAIVSIWCHVPEGMRKGLHARCVEGLKSGGVFILEAYTPKQLEFKTGGPPVAMMLMSKAALDEELAGLKLEVSQETEREIHEGPLHDGHSAVVQVVGVKP